MSVNFNKSGPVVVFGEAMIELSDMIDDRAKIDVAGDTFNTAVYMSRSGASVHYVTALGVDPFSDRIRSRLTLENVDSEFVVHLNDKIPGLYAIRTDERGERSFSYWRSESAARHFFTSEEAASVFARIAEARLFYFSGITLSIFSGEDRKKIVRLIETIRQNGGVVAFDTNFRASGWSSQLEASAAIGQVAPYVSIALPTLEDEIDLFGFQSVEECVDHWQGAGAEEIAVKAGPKGAYLSGVGWIEPPEVIQKPVDTTGAGDSFNGAYLAARLSGSIARDAAMAAHQLAAKVLKSPGAII